MIDVLLVTTWNAVCGISEHSAMLKEAVEGVDPEIRLTPWDRLHPEQARGQDGAIPFPIIHLNYHAALHSQWTADWIRQFQAVGQKVLVTYHDTGVPNSDQAKTICAAADAFVVHEPYDDLERENRGLPKGHYWRQGVPDWQAPMQYNDDLRSWRGRRPIVGTVGFPFPWKNYDLLCEASALAGWATLLLAPNATPAQVDRWRTLNPATLVETTFIPREAVVAHLAGCDATAFLYSCANTGTSGAIRQGIAARKPLLALSGCRQFRDLDEDIAPSRYRYRHNGIVWLPDGTPQGVAEALQQVPIQRVDPGIVALAARDSWARLGAKYAALYRELTV